MNHPTRSPELVEAVCRSLCLAELQITDFGKSKAELLELVEKDWPEWQIHTQSALTAAEPFIAARVEAAALAERKAITVSMREEIERC